jgi:hypothetical protein
MTDSPVSRLEEIFSEANLLSCADACLKLGTDIPEKCSVSDIDTLVIPSRGAVPFFLGMLHALPKLGNISPEHRTFYETLGVQKMIAPLLPDRSSPLVDDLENKSTRVLLVPFTADVNMAKYNPKLNNDDFTPRIRDYWARVTASFRYPSGIIDFRRRRTTDPYFKSFVGTVLADIENREEVAEEYVRFPTMRGFAMIDTVISGRASNDILKAFDNLALERGDPRLKPSAFLVIDEEGKKMRPDKRVYLQRKQLEGQVEMYPVSHIVSEDRGAGLLGVASVVYPSVMEASEALTYEGRPFFVGAGSWRLVGDIPNVSFASDTFKHYMETLYRAIDLNFSTSYEGSAGAEEKKTFDEYRSSFIEKARAREVLTNRPVDPASFKVTRPISSYFETHSGVGHASFDAPHTKAILHTLENLKGVKKRG